MENLVILGSGVAGCSAAVYAARADLSPLVISGPEQGGQISYTDLVENYPGFPEGIQGIKLVDNIRKQAEKFSARFKPGNAERIEKKGELYEISIGDEKIEAKSVIIATGASARKLGLESETKYLGKGVSTCATCDAYFFQGKDVVVIGGGDGAAEEALFITKFAKSVTLVHRRDKLRASKIMQDRIFKNEKIKVIWDSSIEEILGDGKKVTGVKLKNLKDNSITEKKIDGIFLAIGHIPNTAAFKGFLEFGKKDYLKIDDRMRTNMPGIFGAGDVADHLYRQAITAAAMGCRAAIEAERYLNEKSK
ncbi:thioredoxin-disulfide reductase [Candidatus Woesearchaeota archaeon]|nr:thioredoxin-disulfide reductase [Candidatus Woesearchaeota archaeon]